MPSSDTSTLGYLQDNGIALWASCPFPKDGSQACRDRKVDLEAAIRKWGREASYIRSESPMKLRCKRCGKLAAGWVIVGR